MTDATDLIDAIRTQTAADMAREIIAGNAPGDIETARAIQQTCGAISDQMLGLRTKLIADCADAGVVAEPVTGPEDRGELQFHATTIRIRPVDLPTALDVARQSGFRLSFDPAPGQLAALATYLTRVPLVRDDTVTARLVLQLDQSAPALPAILTPKMADIASANVPVRAGYVGVRLARVLRDRLTGRRAPSGESDFLGTPQSLITPLLDLLMPGADDVIFDLGCGDGRIVAEAAARCGRAVGVEAYPDLVRAALARIAALDGPIAARASIQAGYAEDADLTQADIVFMFLPPFLLGPIFNQVMSQIRPGTRILTHEQSRPIGLPMPDSRQIVVGPQGLTVANIWRKP